MLACIRVIKKLSLLFRYSWKKDGLPFDWTLYDDRITQQAGRGTLVIKSPRDEDVGKFAEMHYICNTPWYRANVERKR